MHKIKIGELRLTLYRVMIVQCNDITRYSANRHSPIKVYILCIPIWSGRGPGVLNVTGYSTDFWTAR